MAYEKLNLSDGDTFKAEHVTHIEDGIAAVDEAISELPTNDTVGEKVEEYLNNNPVSVTQKAKSGLRIAVFGDSISTQLDLNAVEITVETDDVGVELSAYPTSYDVGTTVGGHTIAESDLGSELTFTPTEDDVGKTIGGAKNYNTIDKVWWQYVAEELGCEVIPVTCSGSSFCSHETDSTSKTYLKTAHAWHPSQIRKAGKRIPGTMIRQAPDVIVLYRGTNDMTHEPYAVMTDSYFDKYNWSYPATDLLSSGDYGAKEAISLTIKKLRIAYPDARIVLATLNVFKRINYDSFPTNNGLYSIPQWNKMVRECADFFGCQVIDFDKDGITFENCYDSGYITDSASIPTHPNAKGHELMGKQALNDLINKVNICDIEPSNSQSSSSGEETGEMILYEGIAVNNTSGALYSADDYYTYDRIPAEANSVYVLTNCRNTALLDADGKVLSVISGATLESASWRIATTADTAYIRTCAKYDTVAIADFSVTKMETSVLHENTSVKTTSATLTSDSTGTYFTYAFVPVEGGSYYNISSGRNVCFLDSTFNYISGVNANDALITGQVLAPTNAASMHVCFKYEDIQPANVTIEKATTNIGYSGYGVNATTGELDSSFSEYWTLDRIPVEPNTKYKVAGCRNTAELDSSGAILNVIKGSVLDTTDATFTTTENTAYIRTCAKSADLAISEFVLEEV